MQDELASRAATIDQITMHNDWQRLSCPPIAQKWLLGRLIDPSGVVGRSSDANRYSSHRIGEPLTCSPHIPSSQMPTQIARSDYSGESLIALINIRSRPSDRRLK